MQVRVIQIGGELGILLPPEIAAELKLKEGDELIFLRGAEGFSIAAAHATPEDAEFLVPEQDQ
jgi:antitoxin component of MazEF toxin-antitoxin module